MNFTPGHAAEPVMAKSLAVFTIAFLANALVMTPGGGGLQNMKYGQGQFIPTSLCTSPNAVHCSLAMWSCKEVVDDFEVFNSKEFWEESDKVEEEALFKMLGSAIREEVCAPVMGVLGFGTSIVKQE